MQVTLIQNFGLWVFAKLIDMESTPSRPRAPGLVGQRLRVSKSFELAWYQHTSAATSIFPTSGGGFSFQLYARSRSISRSISRRSLFNVPKKNLFQCDGQQLWRISFWTALDGTAHWISFKVSLSKLLSSFNRRHTSFTDEAVLKIWSLIDKRNTFPNMKRLMLANTNSRLGEETAYNELSRCCRNRGVEFAVDERQDYGTKFLCVVGITAHSSKLISQAGGDLSSPNNKKVMYFLDFVFFWTELICFGRGDAVTCDGGVCFTRAS